MSTRKKKYYPQLSAKTKFERQFQKNIKDIEELQKDSSSTTTIINNGGSSFWEQVDGEYDYKQSTYYYVGGLDGATHKVNRYEKGNSSVKAQATGLWADRLTLTYI